MIELKTKGRCSAINESCAYCWNGRCFFPSSAEAGYQGRDFFRRCGAFIPEDAEQVPGQVTIDFEKLEREDSYYAS